jgi:phosphotransferase system  glucose/maltose/N-acetylglucosamine-specific IIC component
MPTPWDELIFVAIIGVLPVTLLLIGLLAAIKSGKMFAHLSVESVIKALVLLIVAATFVGLSIFLPYSYVSLVR